MPILKAPMNEEQWEFYAAFKAEVHDGEWFTIMPCMPLSYWLDVNDFMVAGEVRFNRNCKDVFLNSSILFSIAKKEGDFLCLGVAITDDSTSAAFLREFGVDIISWPEVKSLALSARKFVTRAEQAISRKGFRARVTLNLEQNNLRCELMTALNLHLGSNAHAVFTAPPKLQGILHSFIEDKKKQIVVYWEVAISRFIDKEEQDPQDEKYLNGTSSVDILICAPHAGGIPVLVVEYDGWHHRNKENKINNDKAKNRLFEKVGLAIMRIGTDHAPARETESNGKRLPVSPRLPPLLAIAEYLVNEKLKEQNRGIARNEKFDRQWRAIEKMARAMYDGKPIQWLTEHEFGEVLGHCSEQSFIDDPMADQETEWAIDDHYDQQWMTLDKQLAAQGIDPALIEDFHLRNTSKGRVAKCNLRIPGTMPMHVRGIETVSIKLSVPGLEASKVAELEEMQLYVEFANQVKEELCRAIT